MPSRNRVRKLRFSKKEIVEEHEKLVKDLKSGDPKKLEAEARKQAKELKSYKKA
jgi:DNA-binding GntR family transcriptional regulator